MLSIRFNALTDRQLLGERVRQTSLTTGSSRVSLPPRSARRQITNSISPISQNPMETVSAPCKELTTSCGLGLHVCR